MADAIGKELMKLRFRRAVDSAFGYWKPESHPELEEGTDKFLRRLRHSSRMEREKS